MVEMNHSVLFRCVSDLVNDIIYSPYDHIMEPLRMVAILPRHAYFQNCKLKVLQLQIQSRLLSRVGLRGTNVDTRNYG